MRSMCIEFFRRFLWQMRQRTALFTLALAVGACALIWLARVLAPVQAQGSFDSGSTGADGAFAPVASQTIPLPASGVFNYTTVNIPSGVTIKYIRNAKNTPVTILATGAVTIAGTIDVSGQTGALNGPAAGGGAGGPGGFDGGRAGYPFASVADGISGDGPGGGGGGKRGPGGVCFANDYGNGGGGGFGGVGSDGTTNCLAPAPGGKGGLSYGSNTLSPLIGGSGGGGGPAVSATGGAGGGGGGAILIASSGSITFNNGSVSVAGGSGGFSGGFQGCGGGGSGGAIRLVTNTISGSVAISIGGGIGGGSGNGSGGNGAPGYFRAEAFSFTSFNPAIPIGQQTFSSFALPSSVTLPNVPTLKIASVAGIVASAMPVGSFHGPADIVVPSSQTNPVTVALQAANIPLGTIVQVTITPETGAFSTVQSTALAGTVAASTATASVNLPVTGMSVINATASYDLPAGNQRTSQLLIEGERVKRVEVATSYGGKSEVTYITESGKRIKRAE